MATKYPFGTHKVLLFILFMGCFTVTSQAQTAVVDTLELDEVRITATRIDQPLTLQPTNVEVIDSTRLSLLDGLDIGQVLAYESSLFIKQNGPGGFSNASQRGLSSEQIQVLWEGVPINNVMLGQKDLSLLPATFFTNVQINSGAPSTSFGGGSMGGSIYLTSDIKGSNKLSIQQQAGSFGQWQSSLDGQYSEENLNVSIYSSIDRAENDYEYYNRAYDREEHRQHNRQAQENVMAGVGHRSPIGKWKTMFWYSNSDNQIPGSILNTTSEARQKDKSLRWLTTYQTHVRGAKISVKNYFDRVELNYFDPKIDTRSLSLFKRWMGSTSITKLLSRHFLLKGEVSGAVTGVETSNYSSDKTRRQLSLLTNPEITITDSRFRVYPALRVDAYNDFGTVLSPSLGLNYILLQDKLFLRGQISKNFNPPTFNALYWGQGGNPDLDPERSNSAEAGLILTSPTSWIHSLQFTGFYTTIDNGIRWYPDDSGIYTPSNVEQITTKGLEAELSNRINLGGDFQFELKQSGSLVRAEITEPRFPGDAAVGNQLRYVPKWKYHASLSLQKGFVCGLLQYRWVGRRYISDEEEIGSSLEPHQVVDATLQLQKSYNGFEFTAQGSIRNLLGTNYEIVQWYAMPQRNFNSSLTITYHF